MKFAVLFLFLLTAQVTTAQGSNPIVFENDHISFSGDSELRSGNDQVVTLTGNVSFSTSIVEIEKAEKIVYDKETKTFTISGFKELRLNGKKKLASDFGTTTLKLELGDCVAYLVTSSEACDEKTGKGC